MTFHGQIFLLTLAAGLPLAVAGWFFTRERTRASWLWRLGLSFLTALALFLGSAIANAAELLPGTVYFDPPAFLVDKGNGNDPTVIKWYIARDNVLGKTTRRLGSPNALLDSPTRLPTSPLSFA